MSDSNDAWCAGPIAQIQGRTERPPWTIWLPSEEKKAINSVLAGGDSPIRELVCSLLDRIDMNFRNRMRNNRHAGASDLNSIQARVEAYRYCLMVACKLQNAEDAKGHTVTDG